MPLGKQVGSSQLRIFPENFQPRPHTLKYPTRDGPNVTEWAGRVGTEVVDAATVANSQEEPREMKNRTTT